MEERSCAANFAVDTAVITVQNPFAIFYQVGTKRFRGVMVGSQGMAKDCSRRDQAWNMVEVHSLEFESFPFGYPVRVGKSPNAFRQLPVPSRLARVILGSHY